MRTAIIGGIVILGASGCFFLGEEERPPVGPPGPEGLAFAAMAYDTDRDRLVLQGGQVFDERTPRSATWELAGNAWTLVDELGPGPRRDHRMAYYPRLRQLVLVGGSNGDGVTGCDETWLHQDGAWRKHPTGDLGPGCRNGASLSYDPIGDRVLMYGGGPDCAAQRCQETWAWSGESWSLLDRPVP
jgi:hypothetical protein